MLAVLFKPFMAKQNIGSLLLLGGIAMALALVVVTLAMAGQMLDIDPDVIAQIKPGDLEACVERNSVENVIIPSTWWEAGAGLNGNFSNGLSWEWVGNRFFGYSPAT